MAWRDGRRWTEDPTGPGDVEEGLVQGDALHQRGEIVEDFVELHADLGVAGEASRQEDGVRAPPAGFDRGHGRVDAEGPGFVGAGGDHPPVPRPTDNDGLAGQGGIVEDFDGGEESVEVDVHDGAGVDAANAVLGPARSGHGVRR